MLEKQCTDCGQTKPLSEFHRNHRMPDGHVNQCKECDRPKKRAWNKANPDRIAAASKRWAKNHPERYQKYRAAKRKRRQQRDRQDPAMQPKLKANRAVWDAVRKGRLIRPEVCSECNRPGEIHGHHDDYSKPLEVRWLCSECHRAHHERTRPHV